jgi:hypothetical protein
MGGNDFMLLSELQVVLACNELRLEFLSSKIHKIGLRRDNSTKELVPQDLSRLMNHLSKFQYEINDSISYQSGTNLGNKSSSL